MQNVAFEQCAALYRRRVSASPPHSTSTTIEAWKNSKTRFAGSQRFSAAWKFKRRVVPSALGVNHTAHKIDFHMTGKLFDNISSWRQKL